MLVHFSLSPAGSSFGANATISLYPAVGQGHQQNQSGFGWVTPTFSMDPVVGTSFRIAKPVSYSRYRAVSNSFPMPQTGIYMIGMTVDSQPVANSDLGVKIALVTRPGKLS